MKNILLTVAATAAMLVGSLMIPSEAEAQRWRRGWYGSRPYYGSYYRPYYRRSYYYPGYYGYYPRYYGRWYGYPGYYRYGYPYYYGGSGVYIGGGGWGAGIRF
jgi:hypothetical protein